MPQRNAADAARFNFDNERVSVQEITAAMKQTGTKKRIRGNKDEDGESLPVFLDADRPRGGPLSVSGDRTVTRRVVWFNGAMSLLLRPTQIAFEPAELELIQTHMAQ